jgi:hypothetical protein
MGRTIPSFRVALEEEIATWRQYRKTLKGGSRGQLDRIFAAARRNCSASSNAVRPSRFDAMLMAVVFDHERRTETIAREVERTRLELHAGD